MSVTIPLFDTRVKDDAAVGEMTDEQLNVLVVEISMSGSSMSLLLYIQGTLSNDAAWALGRTSIKLVASQQCVSLMGHGERGSNEKWIAALTHYKVLVPLFAAACGLDTAQSDQVMATIFIRAGRCQQFQGWDNVNEWFGPIARQMALKVRSGAFDTTSDDLLSQWGSMTLTTGQYQMPNIAPEERSDTSTAYQPLDIVMESIPPPTGDPRYIVLAESLATRLYSLICTHGIAISLPPALPLTMDKDVAQRHGFHMLKNMLTQLICAHMPLADSVAITACLAKMSHANFTGTIFFSAWQMEGSSARPTYYNVLVTVVERIGQHLHTNGWIRTYAWFKPIFTPVVEDIAANAGSHEQLLDGLKTLID